jgi:hypothetical protein
MSNKIDQRHPFCLYSPAVEQRTQQNRQGDSQDHGDDQQQDPPGPKLAEGRRDRNLHPVQQVTRPQDGKRQEGQDPEEAVQLSYKLC